MPRQGAVPAPPATSGHPSGSPPPGLTWAGRHGRGPRAQGLAGPPHSWHCPASPWNRMVASDPAGPGPQGTGASRARPAPWGPARPLRAWATSGLQADGAGPGPLSVLASGGWGQASGPHVACGQAEGSPGAPGEQAGKAAPVHLQAVGHRAPHSFTWGGCEGRGGSPRDGLGQRGPQRCVRGELPAGPGRCFLLWL